MVICFHSTSRCLHLGASRVAARSSTRSVCHSSQPHQIEWPIHLPLYGLNQHSICKQALPATSRAVIGRRDPAQPLAHAAAALGGLPSVPDRGISSRTVGRFYTRSVQFLTEKIQGCNPIAAPLHTRDIVSETSSASLPVVSRFVIWKFGPGLRCES